MGGTGYAAGEGTNVWAGKIDAQGVLVWSRSHNSYSSIGDSAFDVAADSAGNAIVTGTVGDEINYWPLVWTRKYDPDGNELWTRSENEHHAGIAAGHAVATDSADNVLVTGLITTPRGDFDLWVGKYDPDGTLLWHNVEGTEHNEVGEGIAADSAGNVVVAGWTEGGSPRQQNLLVTKYDPEGRLLWTRKYDRPEEQADEFAMDVAVDAEDNVIVVGAQEVEGEETNILIRKYSP